ncbi:hypothetical protein CVS40_8079 [Lucilia cuprina]|nr:hypothetical protein CVS40_8079 [Lucilia cuprina]
MYRLSTNANCQPLCRNTRLGPLGCFKHSSYYGPVGEAGKRLAGTGVRCASPLVCQKNGIWYGSRKYGSMGYWLCSARLPGCLC